LTGFDQIEFSHRTDVGVRRSHNQDDFAMEPASDPERFQDQGHLFLVADGMGGHAVGEKASAKAVRDIPHTYHKYAQEGPAQALRKAFTEANAGIHAIGEENPEFRGLGTTATAVLLRAEGAWVSHVGDSRAYRIRGGVIEQLTFDHSAVWEIARRQQVSPEELQGIRSNVILRSLGPDSMVEVDIEGPHPILPGDIYLLCSDGLTGMLSDHEIGAVAAALPPAEACDFLVDLANLRGGPDNVTVIITRVGGTPDTAEVADDAPPPRPIRRRSIPWPLTALVAGIVLAVAALVMMTAGWLGGLSAVVLAVAAAAIGIGLFGLGLHGQQDDHATDEDPAPPKLRIYRSARCKIERPLVDKLIKAENNLDVKLREAEVEVNDAEYQKLRARGDQALGHDDLPEAFREHCRAMHVLLKSYNRQRQKIEVFQPLWDKHIPD
jgi:protein phosphatase